MIGIVFFFYGSKGKSRNLSLREKNVNTLCAVDGGKSPTATILIRTLLMYCDKHLY